MARQFPSRRGSSLAPAQRRRTAWENGPGGSDIASWGQTTISTSATTILGSGITPTVDPFTIIRIHGLIECQLITAAAVGDGFNFAAGIGIVSTTAFVVGSGSVPSPFDDIEWGGWMWHKMWSMRTAVAGLAVGDPSVNPMLIPVETKAMRKLGVEETVALILQTGENTTAVVNVSSATRMLLKLA